MKCLEDGRLQAYIDGELADAARADLDRHLDGCPACREKLAHLRSAGERAKARISSLDPARIPAPPPLRTGKPRRPSRTWPFWRRLGTSSIRVPAAAAAMAALFALGLALGTILTSARGVTEQTRFARRAEAAGLSLQGARSLQVSSLSLDLEKYRPVADPKIFTIKEQ